MANASAKKTASQNDATIKSLQIGLLIATLLSLSLRLVFRLHSLSPKRLSFWLHLLSHVPSVVFSRYLIQIGTPKRDAAGSLISSGEDLSRPGIIEWCFDVIYVTWAAQIGSAAFGEWAWLLFAIIPLYAGWKLWTMFIGPYFGFGRSSPTELGDDSTDTASTSKRQEKLRKRQERGDPRVRSQTVKR